MTIQRMTQKHSLAEHVHFQAYLFLAINNAVERLNQSLPDPIENLEHNIATCNHLQALTNALVESSEYVKSIIESITSESD
ncbi:hypothetical protein ABIB38_004302 [Massilia sp. UYP11]|uniref:hypothetical protein n=1 Tax=Massilia sp. UYP11 TaxID=1756385 RepID=UPI003D20F005